MIPKFYTKVNSGSVSIFFQTSSRVCELRFDNEMFKIIVNKEVVFEAGFE
jgi:hypothetical protein